MTRPSSETKAVIKALLIAVAIIAVITLVGRMSGQEQSTGAGGALLPPSPQKNSGPDKTSPR